VERMKKRRREGEREGGSFPYISSGTASRPSPIVGPITSPLLSLW